MNIPREKILIFAALFALAITSCASPTATPSDRVDTGDDVSGESPGDVIGGLERLIGELEEEGIAIEQGEKIEQPFFGVEGQILRIEGMDVQFYAYESAEAARKEADAIAPDGSSVGTSMVTWVDTPHFYLEDEVIALYVGDDEKVLEALEEALGQQIAGGEKMVAEDGLSMLIQDLEAAGASVERGEDLSQPFFSVRGTVLKLQHGEIQVFAYDDMEQANMQVVQISEDGQTIGMGQVNWVDTPHFYQRDRFIVLYVGRDATVLELLDEVLGPQIAGG
jgi:hypothetical protein